MPAHNSDNIPGPLTYHVDGDDLHITAGEFTGSNPIGNGDKRFVIHDGVRITTGILLCTGADLQDGSYVNVAAITAPLNAIHVAPEADVRCDSPDIFQHTPTPTPAPPPATAGGNVIFHSTDGSAPTVIRGGPGGSASFVIGSGSVSETHGDTSGNTFGHVNQSGAVAADPDGRITTMTGVTSLVGPHNQEVATVTATPDQTAFVEKGPDGRLTMQNATVVMAGQIVARSGDRLPDALRDYFSPRTTGRF